MRESPPAARPIPPEEALPASAFRVSRRVSDVADERRKSAKSRGKEEAAKSEKYASLRKIKKLEGGDVEPIIFV